jgi:hypothetical protein
VSRSSCTWGVALDIAREIVGHSDIEVTITVYAHTSICVVRGGGEPPTFRFQDSVATQTRIS